MIDFALAALFFILQPGVLFTLTLGQRRLPFWAIVLAHAILFLIVAILLRGRRAVEGFQMRLKETIPDEDLLEAGNLLFSDVAGAMRLIMGDVRLRSTLRQMGINVSVSKEQPVLTDAQKIKIMKVLTTEITKEMSTMDMAQKVLPFVRPISQRGMTVLPKLLAIPAPPPAHAAPPPPPPSESEPVM